MIRDRPFNLKVGAYFSGYEHYYYVLTSVFCEIWRQHVHTWLVHVIRCEYSINCVMFSFDTLYTYIQVHVNSQYCCTASNVVLQTEMLPPTKIKSVLRIKRDPLYKWCLIIVKYHSDHFNSTYWQIKKCTHVMTVQMLRGTI